MSSCHIKNEITKCWLCRLKLFYKNIKIINNKNFNWCILVIDQH